MTVMQTPSRQSGSTRCWLIPSMLAIFAVVGHCALRICPPAIALTWKFSGLPTQRVQRTISSVGRRASFTFVCKTPTWKVSLPALWRPEAGIPSLPPCAVYRTDCQRLGDHSGASGYAMKSHFFSEHQPLPVRRPSRLKAALGRHATGVARRANATVFAGEGHQIVMPAVVTSGARKAVGEDIAFEVVASGLFYIAGGMWWSP